MNLHELNQRDNEVIDEATEYFNDRNGSTKSIETRFYYEGKAVGYTYNFKSGIVTIKYGAESFEFILPKEESVEPSESRFKVFPDGLYFILVTHPRPEFGNEMNFSTRKISLSERGLEVSDPKPGAYTEIKKVGDEKSEEGYVFYDGAAPVLLKIGDRSINLNPKLYFSEAYYDADDDLTFKLARGYEDALYKLNKNGEFQELNATGTYSDSIIKGSNSIYALFQDYGTTRYGSIVSIDYPKQDVSQRIKVVGKADERLYDLVGSIGNYLLIEAYDSSNSFYLTLWVNKNGEFVKIDPTNIEGVDEGFLSIFKPSINGKTIKPFKILGSNEQTISIWIGNDESKYTLYNLSSIKNSELKISVPSDTIEPNSTIIQDSLAVLPLFGEQIGVVTDTNTLRGESNIYDSDVSFITSYGGRYSLVKAPIHPGTLAHLKYSTRGLAYNMILSSGAQTDYEVTNRINPNKLKPRDFVFGPSEEMADYLIEKIIHQGESKVIAEGGSFAGITILLTVVTLINRFVDDKLSYEELLKVFSHTLFSTISAVMDPSNIRPHNQPYYFSEKYVSENFPSREDLMEIAKFRSPLKSVPIAIKKLEKHISNRERFEAIMKSLKISLYTFTGDTRCPIQPHREFAEMLESYNINYLFSALEGGKHGYYLQKEYGRQTITHWRKQNNMFN